MNLARFRPTRRHAPLFIALALAACGGGGGGAVGSVVATITGGVVPQPAPTPTPTPTPSPTTEVTTAGGGMAMPMPTATTVVSPTLAGLAPVASGVDVASNLWKASGTGDIPAADPKAEDGAFRFLCAPSHNAYDDPIVYPGQPGKSHLHTFFGNTKADANSTYASLRTTGEGTCNNLLNRSAYWIAAMMHPSGKVVMPDYISIYYKRAPTGSANCKPPVSQGCLALPRGLRYIFGYNMTDPTKNDPANLRWFNCYGEGDLASVAVSGAFATIKEAARGCPAGAMFGMVLVGPNCWNGKDLDSPDHRSHMAYTSYGDTGQSRCPATHPYLVPFFETASWYRSDGTVAQWKLSSDIQMGTEGGVTAHADWWGAWEDSIKDRWSKNCIDEGRSCSGGDLGDGFMLANTAKYAPYTGKTVLADAPARAMDPGQH